METASEGPNELPGRRLSPQLAGSMDEVDAMDVDQQILSMLLSQQPSGGQGHDRMSAVEEGGLAALTSFATADQHVQTFVPNFRDDGPSASAAGPSAFGLSGSRQTLPLRPVSNPSVVGDSINAAEEVPYVSGTSASDMAPGGRPPSAASHAAADQLLPSGQDATAQPTTGGHEGAAQIAQSSAAFPVFWPSGMTAIGSVSAGSASRSPSTFVPPAEGRSVPYGMRGAFDDGDDTAPTAAATAVLSTVTGGWDPAVGGAQIGDAAEGSHEDAPGSPGMGCDMSYRGHPAAFGAVPSTGRSQGRQHDGAGVDPGEEVLPEAGAGLLAPFGLYDDDYAEGLDEEEEAEEAGQAAAGRSEVVMHVANEQVTSAAAAGAHPPHTHGGHAASSLRHVQHVHGDSAGGAAIHGRTTELRRRGQYGAGGGQGELQGSGVNEGAEGSDSDDEGDYSLSAISRWHELVERYDAGRALGAPRPYDSSRLHDYSTCHLSRMRHLGLLSGGAGSAGPSTRPATAAGAGASGSGGGGLLRHPCPGPELVTADPWSEDEDEDTDTTAEQFYAAMHPKDIQGIPWERLQFNRSTYRDTRLRQYRNYTNVLPDDDGGAYRAELAPLCAEPRRCGTAGVAAARGPPFFSFVRNSRAVQSNIVHFQLRNLVWATSPNDVFVVHDNCVNHWSPASRTVTEVLNLAGGGGAPRAGSSGRVPGLGRVQISTLCVSGDLVAAGGFMGELVVKRLSGAAMQQLHHHHHHRHHHHYQQAAAAAAGDGSAAARRPGPAGPRLHRVLEPQAAAAGAAAGGGVHTRGRARQGPGGSGASGGNKAGGGSGMQGSLLYCGRITSSDNGITNGLEIFRDRSHGTVIMAANNDSQLRLFAAAAGEGSLRPLARWPFDWAVNYATVRPDSHLAAVVGDDSATLLTDVHNGATVAKLHGHRDFSFAAAWHPGGMLLATGNQDTTTLLWDVRRTDEPLTRLAGRMGAIRSLRFTPDGRFLAMSEPADFVHVYDVASGFQDCQEHDFFGEIAGIAFTPDSSSLFVGISDLTYASLMQLDRQKCDWR